MEAVLERAVRRWPEGPDWTRTTVVILASGPSLTVEQVRAVGAWRATAPGARVIAINTTFLLAPWADVLYACDARWWDHHIREVRDSGCSSEFWSIEAAADKHGVRIIESKREAGLCREPGVIHEGMNSGYQAVSFAWQCGAARMVLLGFDMQDVGGRAHWHGDHPHRGGRRANPYALWLKKFITLAADLKVEGCEVVNCTPGSALGAFPRMPLAEALEDVR